MEKKKKFYMTPELTVVAFKAERGYLISSAKLDADRTLFEYGSSDPHVTQYDQDDSWASYTWQ